MVWSGSRQTWRLHVSHPKTPQIALQKNSNDYQI
ncbi:RalBP1-associated Eps domain-containing protein 1, partial [Araneus ventricosus]